MMWMGGGRFQRRRHLVIGIPTLLFCLVFYTFLSIESSSKYNSAQSEHLASYGKWLNNPLTKGLTFLPYEYLLTPVQMEACENRFNFGYLQNFRETNAEYCKPESVSSMTCFSNNVDPQGTRHDHFCIAGPVQYDVKGHKFNLYCEDRSLTREEQSKGLQVLEQFPSYWYGTGPRYILDKYINRKFDTTLESVQSVPNLSARMHPKILIKREKANHNMWHSLMEIMSTYFTIDVLRSTTNPTTNQPYFHEDDASLTQVVILDDITDGPWIDLWRLFARKPIIRLNDIPPHEPWGQIIIPLPGGSNPFWQGDWKDLPCNDSSLLQAFSNRVLDFYKINPIKPKKPEEPIIVTYIDRRTKRKLVDQHLNLETLRSKLPLKARLNIVDFTEHSFAKQLEITRATDVLVGVHGAGLTHGMFLPPKSAIVEFMPFALDHKGFSNMARMLGHEYFVTKTLKTPGMTGGEADWQEDDVYVDIHDFSDAVLEAVNKIMKLRAGKKV